MEKELKFIGRFLGMDLWIDTNDEKRAELAEKVLTKLILREDYDVDKEIAKMKLEKK